MYYMIKKNILFLISSMAIISPFTILSAKCENRNDEAKNTNENENNSSNRDDTSQDSNNDKNEIIPNPSPNPSPIPVPDHSNNDKDNQNSNPNPNPQPQPQLKPNNQWSEESKEVEGLSFDKYSELANFYRLTNELTVEEAISKIINKEENGIKISNIKIIAFDESKGTLSISIGIEEKDFKVSNKEINISGFKKIEIFDENSISIFIDNEKLFEQNKKIVDIENKDLESYIKIIGISSLGNKINIIGQIKKHPKNYFVDHENKIKFSNSKKEGINFELNINYDRKVNNNVEKISKKIKVINKKIQNKDWDNKKILDHLIDNYITIKNDIDFNRYPSFFLNSLRNTKKVADNFLNNEKEDYFNKNDGLRIEFANEDLNIDDQLGELDITFSLKIKEDNGVETYSKTKKIKIQGFKKLTIDYLNNYFNLRIDTVSESGKKFAANIKKYYLKNKTLDFNYVIRHLNKSESNKKTLLSLIDTFDNLNTTELKIFKNSIIKLDANSKDIEEVIRNGTQINFLNSEDSDNFEIENLAVNFKSLKIDDNRNNMVWLNYDLEISLNPRSEHQKNIIIPKSTFFIF
ncbi:Hypothetical protein, predicted lipoprotein [Metamycoplasma alkalescens 14918]|uniref:Uncharacterized protein n=2 Tax=Metamycoplasma alkalescens TaxID=45363 RepID=N9SQT5_9BACT|nr:Hypothetical protein, predicted lipoprotein [Metamycoplasma alkalescens 14918]